MVVVLPDPFTPTISRRPAEAVNSTAGVSGNRRRELGTQCSPAGPAIDAGPAPGRAACNGRRLPAAGRLHAQVRLDQHGFQVLPGGRVISVAPSTDARRAEGPLAGSS